MSDRHTEDYEVDCDRKKYSKRIVSHRGTSGSDFALFEQVSLSRARSRVFSHSAEEVAEGDRG